MVYTVVGVYADNDYQRFAFHIEADSPEEAEKEMVDAATDAGAEAIVAGVFNGKLTAVDP